VRACRSFRVAQEKERNSRTFRPLARLGPVDALAPLSAFCLCDFDQSLSPPHGPPPDTLLPISACATPAHLSPDLPSSAFYFCDFDQQVHDCLSCLLVPPPPRDRKEEKTKLSLPFSLDSTSPSRSFPAERRCVRDSHGCVASVPRSF
jgi:hypothetical protein